MTIAATIRINQLLGRLVYFHVLFIEPHLATTAPPPVTVCCQHGSPQPRECQRVDVKATAWAALADIAAELGAEPCTGADGDCCPTCGIRACAHLIAATWLDVEHRTYGYSTPIPEPDRLAWPMAAADRIATAFERQFGPGCGATSTHNEFTALAHLYPLLGELVALWSDPTGATPVVSWLNHCGDLEDIARHLTVRTAS